MDIIKSDVISLHGAAISMIGGRQENQDDLAYLDTPLGFLIVVCDGMGGGPGGKTASSIVKHEMAKAILECSPQTPRDHAFKMAAARAHQALEDRMKENPALSGMGSTFVAVLLNKQSAVIAHVGDSRCYRLHGKKCLFRTQDHSLVAELVRRRVMTEEEARRSPQSNVITRGLGSTSNHVPEIDEIPYKKGDRFVLCTDGVWGAMPHQKLLETFSQQPSDIQKLLSDISIRIDKIGFLKGGGHDNHTIAMFELEKDSELKDDVSWKKWIIFSLSAVVVIILLCGCLWAIFNSNSKNDHSTSQASVSISSEIPTTDDSSNYEHSTNNNNEETSSSVDDKVHVGVDNNALDAESETGYKSSGEINENNQLQEDTRNKLLERMGRLDKDSDSIAKQKTKKQEIYNVPNPTETAQKIINRYDSAKVVRGETIEEAQKKLDEKKAEIKGLFVTLSRQTQNDDRTHQRVLRISNVVENPVSWYIDKDPDKNTNLYGPTRKARDYMERQTKRMKELKDSLETEKNN